MLAKETDVMERILSSDCFIFNIKMNSEVLSSDRKINVDVKREKRKCYNMSVNDDYSQLMITNVNKSLSIKLCFSDYVNVQECR